MTAETVLQALSALRAPRPEDEYDLHGLVASALEAARLPFLHEAPLAPRCRIDFLCERIGIEIKRDRPVKSQVEKQLRRYAESGKVTALILVSEKAVSLPHFLAGVAIHSLSLQKLWGVAAQGEGSLPEASAPDPSKIPDPILPADADADASPAPLPLPRMQKPPMVEDQILHTLACEEVPAFLQPVPPAQETYGTLSYNARRKCWVIKGEPCVTELAKRLFPGSDQGKRGEARFTAHRRIVGDVNWLMLRYPLLVKPADQQRWEKALEEARDYAVHRELARRMPEKVQPDPAVFKGQLTDFQQEGLAFLLRGERCLLADEMGLGKTVQVAVSVQPDHAKICHSGDSGSPNGGKTVASSPSRAGMG